MCVGLWETVRQRKLRSYPPLRHPCGCKGVPHQLRRHQDAGRRVHLVPSRPRPTRCGRWQPHPAVRFWERLRAVRPFAGRGHAENSLKPLYGLPSAFAGHTVARFGRGAASTWLASFPSPLFDAGPAGPLGVDAAGRPSSRRLPGRRGAQRRARAAPLGAGTGATRSHAQRPFGREHGEHGEDPPLARSEHRGTRTDLAKASALSTRQPCHPHLSTAQSSISLNFLTSGPKSGSEINDLQGRSQPNGRSIPTKREVYPNQTGGLSQPNGRSPIATRRAFYPNFLEKIGWIKLSSEDELDHRTEDERRRLS